MDLNMPKKGVFLPFRFDILKIQTSWKKCMSVSCSAYINLWKMLLVSINPLRFDKTLIYKINISCTVFIFLVELKFNYEVQMNINILFRFESNLLSKGFQNTILLITVINNSILKCFQGSYFIFINRSAEKFYVFIRIV